VTPPARVVVLAVALATSGAIAGGCAHHAGKQATAGALTGLQQQTQQYKAETGQYMAETIGGRATQGGLNVLTSPEQVQRLQELTGEIATTAVQRALDAALTPAEGEHGESPIEVASGQVARAIERELTRALAADLGKGGEGPLGQALAGTTARMSGSATQGVLAAFFPECSPGESHCLDRRFAELAKETAAGAVRGFSRGIAWLLVAGSFVAGVIATLLLIVTIRLFRGGGRTEARASQRTAEV
jgi:hypothetical protein